MRLPARSADENTLMTLLLDLHEEVESVGEYDTREGKEACR